MCLCVSVSLIDVCLYDVCTVRDVCAVCGACICLCLGVFGSCLSGGVYVWCVCSVDVCVCFVDVSAWRVWCVCTVCGVCVVFK